MTFRTKIIPNEDKEALKAAYSALPHEALNYDADMFVHYIGARIYTEWCMAWGEGRGRHDSHRSYNGSAFKKFIDNETHYALERAGHKVIKVPRDESKFGNFLMDEQFENLGTEEYTLTRNQVLTGLAKKAIEFFTKDEAKELGELNLRGSLAEYI